MPATGFYQQKLTNGPETQSNPVTVETGQPLPQAQTGLAGYEDALLRGLGASLSSMDEGTRQAVKALMDSGRGALNESGQYSDEAIAAIMNSARGGLEQEGMYTDEALGRVGSGYDNAVNMLTGYSQGGAEAQQLQAALSGAMGPQAQQEAMASFMSSPGQNYLVEQAERAITRNAAATGGTQGGNVQKELLRNAIGLASQDFDNTFRRLGTVADRGYNASSTASQFLRDKGLNEGNILLGRGASELATRLGVGKDVATLKTNRGQDELGTRLRIGENVASLKDSAGLNAAELFYNTGQSLGSVRNQTGRDLASAIGSTTSALSGLQESQGAVQSDILGGAEANIGNLLSGYGQLSAQQKQTLATILANLATGGSTQMANLEGAIGEARAAGLIGKGDATKEGIQNLAKVIAML